MLKVRPFGAGRPYMRPRNSHLPSTQNGDLSLEGLIVKHNV